MSGTSITIPNTLLAINDGTIPGAFTADRKIFRFPTVKTTNSHGKEMSWTLEIKLQKNGRAVAIDEKFLKPDATLDDSYVAMITTLSGQTEGKIRESDATTITTGKNLGKKNATNQVTQAFRTALGTYNKHKKKTTTAREAPPAAEKKAKKKVEVDDGDDDNGEEVNGEEVKEDVVEKGAGSSSPFDEIAAAKGIDFQPPPQLVKWADKTGDAKLDEKTFAAGGYTAQRKYNGVRCVMYLAPSAGGKLDVVMYSRGSGEYPGTAHIRAEVRAMLEKAPSAASVFGGDAAYAGILDHFGAPKDAPAVYLDGEIFLHGKPLQWISGQARKGNDSAEKLEYHVYDCFFPLDKHLGHDMTYVDRNKYLQAFFAANAKTPHPHVKPVENFVPKSRKALDDLLKQFLAEKYEGVIVRKNGAGYRYSYNNYHSANVLKIKPVYDAEFKVTGFTKGKKGKDADALIWICEVGEKESKDPTDRQFNVVPKNMTIEARKKLFKCLGAKVTDVKDAQIHVAGTRAFKPDGKITRFDRDVYGRPLTVAFSERTSSGKPSQAKALIFRTYEGADDPVKKLYEDCNVVLKKTTK